MIGPEIEYYDRHRIYPPFDDFSKAEFNQFVAAWYGFALGYLAAIKPRWYEPFLMRVHSESILFGFRSGAFFEEEFESPEACDAAEVAHRARIAAEIGEHQADAPLVVPPA